MEQDIRRLESRLETVERILNGGTDNVGLRGKVTVLEVALKQQVLALAELKKIGWYCVSSALFGSIGIIITLLLRPLL